MIPILPTLIPNRIPTAFGFDFTSCCTLLFIVEMANATLLFDDEKEGEMDFDINRLSSQDRQAILSRITPDTSVPTDASIMFQNDIRREVLRTLNACGK